MKQPAPVYQRIAGHQWRHIWLSGDIHGCLEQLRRKVYVVCSYWNNIGFVR
ncbi:phosphatase 1 [Escherichia coli DEC9D]|nr:phosphatase 1 [Escherichia coli DEC9D]